MKLLDFKNNKSGIKNIHFIGIGGIGMSGIAEILCNLGYKVQGSDLSKSTPTLTRLENLGVKIFHEHASSNVLGSEVVVVSTAIPAQNPEIKKAKELEIPIIKRSEMLAELMRLKISIAVSGTHGKTTTTSLIGTMFENAGLNPTVINGGIINNKSTNAYLGAGDFLIAEADESDGTFIRVPANIAVITNIDEDHLNYYGNFENYKKAFEQFIENLPFYGFAVACIDDPETKALTNKIIDRKIITYGIDDKSANVLAVNIKEHKRHTEFDVTCKFKSSPNKIVKNIILPCIGKHNILNSLAAISIGVELDFHQKLLANSFKNFSGIKRRFSHVCNWRNHEIYDDYAHHPAEITAVINTAIQLNSGTGQLIIILQPHRYSRLDDLFSDYVNACLPADVIYVMNVYAAGEEKGVFDSADLVKQITQKRSPSQVPPILLSDEDALKDSLIINTHDKSGVILFMGAGNITKIANSCKNWQDSQEPNTAALENN